jgi:hypothetical protein
MRAIRIYDTARFYVVSHGNGLAYIFNHKPDDLEVFFQGDDATTFREQLEAYESIFPNEASDSILARLWGTYSCVAEPH